MRFELRSLRSGISVGHVTTQPRITGCGSHPQIAERVEELEESVWSVVRQENEREDQGEGVQNSGKTSTDVRGRDMGVEEGTGINWRSRNENATMGVRSYEAGQDQT